MKILNMILGNRSNQVYDILTDERASPAQDGKAKYWTRQNVEWSTARGIRVIKNEVYVVRNNSEDELIATRLDERTAQGYADALHRNRCVPILSIA